VRLVALALACALGGQFATGTDLVEVYATVTTTGGRPVTTLTRDDFVVRENGVPQGIETFAVGDFPLSVALALDRSWSMAGQRLVAVKAAATTFLDQLRHDDEAMLLAIGSEVDTLSPLSRDRAAQRAAVDTLEPWGSTPLHDAIIEAVDRIGRARGRRALLILSDGNDRYSRASADDVVARVRGAGVLIYSVVLGREATPLLAQLTRISGGRAFEVENTEDIGRAFADVAAELRHQYLLGYEPTRGPAGQWRRIAVQVPRGMVVRARTGYVAP
jgi:Ca-activated chloride channel family protein